MSEAPREAQSHLMQRLMAGSTLLDVAYHYTTATGLLGILHEKTIWATEIRYLNDTKEFQYTVDLASAHLSKVEQGLHDDEERTLVQQWIQALRNVQQVPVYVTSFSEDGDQLSQWRAYGRGAGFAIGFKPIVLMRVGIGIASDLPGAWLKCIYDEQKQQGYLQYATDYLLGLFRSGPKPAPPDDLTYRMGFEVDFFGHLLALASCFKHRAFREEREWRLIFRQRSPDTTVQRRRFRSGGRLIVPYVEVPLRSETSPLRIDEVVVGPNPYMVAAVASVRGLLDQEGVQNDGVRASDIPFRDW